MTDSQKLDDIAKDVAEIKGQLGTLAAMHAQTVSNVSKLEGRVWGLLVAVLGAGGTALLSLMLANNGGGRAHAAVNHAREVLAALLQ